MKHKQRDYHKSSDNMKCINYKLCINYLTSTGITFHSVGPAIRHCCFTKGATKATLLADRKYFDGTYL